MLHTGLIASVSELLERHRKERPDKVAYWDAARRVSYSQLASRTASIAAGFSANGVRDGDRIAIFLPQWCRLGRGLLCGLACRRRHRPHKLRCCRRGDRVSTAGCRLPHGDNHPGAKGTRLQAGGRSRQPDLNDIRRGRRERSWPEPGRTCPGAKRKALWIPATSIVLRSSSIRRAQRAVPRACCSPSAECYGSQPPAGHRSAI